MWSCCHFGGGQCQLQFLLSYIYHEHGVDFCPPAFFFYSFLYHLFPGARSNMISVPPGAKLSDGEGANIRSLSSQPVSTLPSSIMISQSDSTSSTSSLSSNHNSESEKPPIYSVESFLDGSTLYPTPRSVHTDVDSEDISVNKPSGKITSFEKKLDPTLYSVDILAKTDDAGYLAPWKRRLYRVSPLSTLLSMVAYFTYFIYRISCTVIAQRVFHKTYIMAWVFIAAEACVACRYCP